MSRATATLYTVPWYTRVSVKPANAHYRLVMEDGFNLVLDGEGFADGVLLLETSH